ncbi:MAG TPA: trehalase family glycosidase, partial [Gammaproteobacteria bacterium]|nr:trehalase family glycosidase [Gammaproteobacteria bacterium]
WASLSRNADREESGSSLISLPRPYIVPGGRFREIYYWDSYFTMLGLAEAQRYDAIEDMVENFAFLIDTVGFVPNGNRTYYCTRSQAPYFVLMVELLAEVRGNPALGRRFLPQLRKEYEFWMQGSDALGDGEANRRVVRIGDCLLNRHWDESDKARPESYAEDIALAAMSSRFHGEVFRDVRAACESGWDFSSRWLAQPNALSSIYTTRIVPVDLNCLLHRLETVLAREHAALGDNASADHYATRAANRRALLQSKFFDVRSGLFVDLLLPELVPTGATSLATAYPLFLGIATPTQAREVVTRLRSAYLAPGGWLTTLHATGQQWDRPLGWAPLQWVVWEGLRRYGFDELAELGARRWIDNNLSVYATTGQFLEKYDVETIGTTPHGGEYEVQYGFGWTNAVLLKLMNALSAT